MGKHENIYRNILPVSQSLIFSIRKTYHGSSSDQFSDSDQSFGDQRKTLLGRDEGDGASADKSPLSSARAPSSLTQHPAARGMSSSLSKSHSSDQISGIWQRGTLFYKNVIVRNIWAVLNKVHLFLYFWKVFLGGGGVDKLKVN